MCKALFVAPSNCSVLLQNTGSAFCSVQSQYSLSGDVTVPALAPSLSTMWESQQPPHLGDQRPLAHILVRYSHVGLWQN